MISPQNLAIGAAAVRMAGKEGDLFGKVVGWRTDHHEIRRWVEEQLVSR